MAIALGVLLSSSAGAATPDKSDVRVLIDISGSMQQNDPKNLRRPALRMLAGLLQPGTRAGVWTFARWVNNLVQVDEVDAAWKTRTQSVSSQIASPGQFTNIELVLDEASADWSGEPTTHARHLVLLTDGMVDVSKQAAENDASRARILDTLLPRLKSAGVKVHTIALSARADHELMQRLAGETGGWYQQVAQADELQRVFLRMFETVGKPDAVPLHDNRFVVDGSISEATVLVFSKEGSAPVVLRSPSGAEYTDSDLTAGVAWFRDQGYDLITIGAPEKGEWSLNADVDPDNRVMVVTDLKLQASEIPAHLVVGEETRIEAYLSNRGELVSRQAFLRLLQMRADATNAAGSQPLALNDAGEHADETAQDGRYTVRYGESEAQPSVELLIAVDSPTFVREKRYRLAFHEPVEALIEEGPDGPVLGLKLVTSVMQPDAGVTVWQQDASGQRFPLQAEQRREGEWSVALADSVSPAYVTVSGTSRLANMVERTLGPIMLPGVEPPAPVAAPVVEEAVAEPPVVVEAAAPVEPAVAEPAAEPVEEEAVAEDDGWVMPAILFGAFNLLLLAGVGTWLFLQRRRAGGADDDRDLDGLVEDIAVSEEATEAPQENAA